MNIVRKEIVEGHELKLRTHPNGDKWMVTRKRHLVGLISMLPTKRYHLDFWYSKYGYTLIEDFDTLANAWKKTKEYISYFKLYIYFEITMRRRDEEMSVESIDIHQFEDGALDTHLIPEHDGFDVQSYTESIPHNEFRDAILENFKRNMSHFIARHFEKD